MFMTMAKKKSLANLARTKTYQQQLDEYFNIEQFLEKSVEENLIDTEIMYKLLLQKGYFKINIQKSQPENQKEIENTKKSLISSNQTNCIIKKEEIDYEDKHYNWDVQSDILSVLVSGCSIYDDKEIDPIYKKTCTFLAKFVSVLEHLLKKTGSDSIFNTDFGDFQYKRLVSLEKSEIQPMCASFASDDAEGWDKYYNAYKQLRITPLSSLFYPEGGSFSCTNTEPNVSISHFLKNEINPNPRKVRLCRNAKRVHLLSIPISRKQIISCEAGDLVISRQDLVYQECGYISTNLRYSMHLDLFGVPRSSNSAAISLFKKLNMNSASNYQASE